jgi:uncharacterized protein involved in exopolysaccharide biosynthesis
MDTPFDNLSPSGQRLFLALAVGLILGLSGLLYIVFSQAFA